MRQFTSERVAVKRGSRLTYTPTLRANLSQGAFQCALLSVPNRQIASDLSATANLSFKISNDKSSNVYQPASIRLSDSGKAPNRKVAQFDREVGFRAGRDL